MCGIVGFTGSQNAAPILLDGLKKLEYRGYDSAGMAVLGQDGIQMVKTIGMIKNLDNKTQGGAALPGTAGIGHTRWATHGEPTDVNAHPHMSNDDKFAIVHNGIIENYAQLREELKAKGFQFKSETDTEVIVHLLDLYYEGDLKKAVLKTVSRLEGAYALGILCAEEGGRLIATRHAAPLIVGVGIGENYFASDVTALVAGRSRTLLPIELPYTTALVRTSKSLSPGSLGILQRRKRVVMTTLCSRRSWSSPTPSSPPLSPGFRMERWCWTTSP